MVGGSHRPDPGAPGVWALFSALATDGEIIAEGRRFQFFTQPAALQVYRPER